MGLFDELKAYQQADLSQMAKELKLIDRMSSETDKVLAKPAQTIYNSASTTLDQHTTVDEDHDSFVQMIKGAIEKSANPAKQGTLSDAAGINPGQEVGLVTGSSSDADLISGESNQVGGDNDVPSGGFSGVIQEAGRDLWDSAKESGQKALNTVSAAITNSPEVVIQTAVMSCAEFIRNGGDLNAAFNRHTFLVNLVNGNVGALDSTYYANNTFWRTNQAIPYLQNADESLDSIRARLIGSRYFDEDAYLYTREYGVKAAADALMMYGNSGNRVAEIRGALTALDYAMALVDKLFSAFWNHMGNLLTYFTGLVTKLVFQGPMLCMINQVQAEIRSIERSMQASIEAGVPTKMSMMEKMWYMELLAIYYKMVMTPRNVLTYIAAQSGPGGHVTAYGSVVSALTGPRSALESVSSMTLLKQQTNQYKYWALRSLEDDSSYVRSKLNDLALQMGSDNLIRTTNISAAISDPAVVGYSTRVDTTDAQSIMNVFQEAGMDRANYLLRSGDWTRFFQLTPGNASTAGNFALSLASVIRGAQSDPTMTFNMLSKLEDAQRYVQNKARATALSCFSWTKEKDGAKRQIVAEDLPEARKMGSGVSQYLAAAGGDVDIPESEA